MQPTYRNGGEKRGMGLSEGRGKLTKLAQEERDGQERR